MTEKATAEVMDRIVIWMINGLSGADLEAACIGKLDIDPADVKAVVAVARKRLTLAAEYNRDELLGTALTRLNDLYSRCVRVQPADLSKALAVQKEINRLTNLHQSLPASGAGGPREGGETEAVAELLHSLELASPDYPLQEHARLAVERIRELESGI